MKINNERKMEGAVIIMAEQITSALTQITTLASSALSIITENPVLMVYFCGGLLGVGFTIIAAAKHASRN